MSSEAGHSWQSVRAEVLGRIRAGRYAPGALIPNEADLAAELGCARATVNRALRDLAEAGWLDRRRRAGTRVVPEPVRRAVLEIPLIRREIEATGAAYAHRLLSRVEAAPAPPEAQAALGLGPDHPVLRLGALHLAGGLPAALEDRVVSLRTVPAIAAESFVALNANEWLIRHAPYTHGEMRVTAVPAGDAAPRLGCAPGDAVLLGERVTWRGAEPITWVRLWFPPGRWMRLAL